MALGRRAAFFLAALDLLLRAQEPVREVVIRTHAYTPPSAVLRAESSLVETGLIVRDSRGRAVAGLHASDFEVLDDGVPRPITAFSELRSEVSTPSTAPVPTPSSLPPCSASTRQPNFVTFSFDDFHVPNGSMLFVKQGARAFIAKGVKPGDHLSIVTASGQGDLDFTTDANLFAGRLEHLSAHIRPVVPSPCGVSPIDSYIFLHRLDGDIVEEAIQTASSCAGCSRGETSAQCRLAAIGIAQTAASSAWEQMLAQSLDTLSALSFAAKRLSQVNGTRTLVLTSSGFLLRPGIQLELQNFIDHALRSNIVVNAIAAQGLEARMGGRKDMVRTVPYLTPLENIANGTGGHYFKDTNDLGGAMSLAADPEVRYSLAFHAGDPDGKFHTLKIRFQAKRVDDLQYRPGYFSPDPQTKPSARARLDEAVFSGQTLREIPTVVNLSAGPPKDGAIPISVAVAVDVSRLQFTAASDRHIQQLVFLTTLLDVKGGFVTGKESIMDLALTDQRLASLKRDGLKGVATLTAPAGVYQVRTIVREGVKGSLPASTTAVDLRDK